MSETILTIKQFSDKHPAFSESSIRWMLHKKDQRPGFEDCYYRISNRVYIKEQAFFDWLQRYSDSEKEKRGVK